MLTNGTGDYSFGNVGPGVYWIFVDSKRVTANAGLNGGFVQGDVWAEQTYGTAGAQCDDGAGGVTQLGAAGVCFGGRRGRRPTTPRPWRRRST